VHRQVEEGVDHTEGGKTSSDLNLGIGTILRQILVDDDDDDDDDDDGLHKGHGNS
jgi:hypothetical protein